MKTQLIALAFLVASSPAGASINMSEGVPLAVTPQPVALDAQPVAIPEPVCGEPRQMIFILRDASGGIVAMGVAEVAPSC
jgi:hypothetical protein